MLRRSLSTLLAVALLTTVQPGTGWAEPRPRTAAELHAEAIVAALHNAARADPASFGYPGAAAAPPLTGWTDVRDVARAWSDHQATGDHRHNPDYYEQLCCADGGGENVGMVSLPDLADATVEAASHRVFQRWMDSAGHRDNILRGAFDEFGVGVSITPDATYGYLMYLTADFRIRDTTQTPPGQPYTVTGAQAVDPVVAAAGEACPESSFTRGVFTDTATGTHGQSVDCLVWWDVIELADGSEGTYGVGTAATRGFMAAILDRLAAAAARPLPEAGDAFADDDGHRYEAAIDRAAGVGLTTGFEDGTFRPDATLTRAQMASFLARLYRDWLGYDLPGTIPDAFTDDDNSPHRGSIDLLAALEIAHGTGDGRFEPRSSLTRGQIASFAARTADYVDGHGVGPAS